MIIHFKRWLAEQERIMSDDTVVAEALELHGVENERVGQAEVAKRLNVNFGYQFKPEDIRVEKRARQGAKFDRARIFFIADINWDDGAGNVTIQPKVVAEIRLRHKKEKGS